MRYGIKALWRYESTLSNDRRQLVTSARNESTVDVSLNDQMVELRH